MSAIDYETERLQLLTAVALLERASKTLFRVLREEQQNVLLDAAVLAKESARGLYLRTRHGLEAPTRTLLTDPLASRADQLAELVTKSGLRAPQRVQAKSSSSRSRKSKGHAK